jgi:MFS family permease
LFGIWHNDSIESTCWGSNLFAFNFGNTFSSVRDNRGLQLYLLSQVARLWGWAALQVALPWLVYSATKSTLTLFWVLFGTFVPMLLFGMTGGYLADRFNRKHILLITQTLNAVLLVGFACLAAQSEPKIWMVAVLYVGIGIVYAHDQPVRNALIMNLIPPDQRVNAFCSEMILSTLTMMAGYWSAGRIIDQLGETKCFLLAALAFLIASVFVFFIHPRARAENEESTETPSGIGPREALSYVVGNRDVRRIFVHNGFALLFGTKYSFLFPAITMMLLHGRAGTFGDLDAANSIGGAAAGVILMNLVLAPNWGGQYAALAGSFLIFILAISGNYALSATTVVLLGMCFTLQNNGNYAVLQTIVPDRLRGRVTAAYLIATQTVDQFGNWLASAIDGYAGLKHTLVVEASICVCVFLYICYGSLKDRNNLVVHR